MDDQVCPRCKTTKYRNPSLKLMVNVCGHALCESCVDLLFLKGSGSCPECNVPLRRSNFRVQIFEDPMVEKEIDIRKRVLKDYNKKEEDFATTREYNDYLEEIETIVYNLANNIDVVGTNKRIEQYKKENKEIIMKNKAKLGQKELELEEILEIEKQMEELRRAEIIRMEQEAKKQKIREKEALIDELMFAEGDAKDILNTFAQTIANKPEAEKVPVVPKVTQFSTGVKFTRGSGQHPIPIIEEGPLYKYEPPVIPDRCGPDPPSIQDIVSNGYLRHVRESSASFGPECGPSSSSAVFSRRLMKQDLVQSITSRASPKIASRDRNGKGWWLLIDPALFTSSPGCPGRPLSFELTERDAITFHTQPALLL